MRHDNKGNTDERIDNYAAEAVKLIRDADPAGAAAVYAVLALMEATRAQTVIIDRLDDRLREAHSSLHHLEFINSWLEQIADNTR